MSPAERRLPLEPAPTRTTSGWSIHLPVRAEQITVSKVAVVYERAVVRRRLTDDVAHVEGTIRREQLNVAHVQPADRGDTR